MFFHEHGDQCAFSNAAGAGYHNRTAIFGEGIEKANVAPGPSLGDAQSRPLWLSMIERLMERPMPMPPLFVV